MSNVGLPVGCESLGATIDELREAWALGIQGGHRSNHRDGDNAPLRIGLMVAHGAHVHRLAASVRLLVENGLAFESVALVREAYETAITTSWIGQNPIASRAMVNDYVNKRRVLRDEFASTANRVFKDGAAGVVVEDHLVRPTVQDQRAKRLQTLCGDFEPAGNDLYAVYRWLSSYSHPGVKVADRYLDPETSPKGPVLLRARYDEGPSAELLLHMTAMTMVWAGSAVNFLARDQARRDWLRGVARRLGGPAILELNAKAKQRIDSELRQGKQASRKRTTSAVTEPTANQ